MLVDSREACIGLCVDGFALYRAGILLAVSLKIRDVMVTFPLR